MQIKSYKHNDELYYPILSCSLPGYYPMSGKKQETVEKLAMHQLRLQLHSIVYLFQKELAKLQNTRVYDYYIKPGELMVKIAVYHWHNDNAEPATYFLKFAIKEKKVVWTDKDKVLPFSFDLNSIQLRD
jgi:hypothetical protein